MYSYLDFLCSSFLLKRKLDLSHSKLRIRVAQTSGPVLSEIWEKASPEGCAT